MCFPYKITLWFWKQNTEMESGVDSLQRSLKTKMISTIWLESPDMASWDSAKFLDMRVIWSLLRDGQIVNDSPRADSSWGCSRGKCTALGDCGSTACHSLWRRVIAALKLAFMDTVLHVPLWKARCFSMKKILVRNFWNTIIFTKLSFQLTTGQML